MKTSSFTAIALGAALLVAAVMPLLVTNDYFFSASYTARWDLGSCDAHARSALDIATRLGLVEVRAKALGLMAGSASMRGDTQATERLARYGFRVQGQKIFRYHFALWGR